MKRKPTAYITLSVAIGAMIFTLPAATDAQESQKSNTPQHHEIQIPKRRDWGAGSVVCMALRCPDSGEPIGIPDSDERQRKRPDGQTPPSYVADPPPKDPDDISDDPRF